MNAVKNLKLIDQAIMSIVEMDDTITCDEQLDCIDALRKLRTKFEQVYDERQRRCR